MLILRQSTAIDIRMGPFVDATDGVTPETGVTLGAADQAEVLKADGAATVAMAGTFAAITGADGWYDYTVATGDVDTVGEVEFVVQDASVCLPVFKTAMVVEEAVYDALYDAGSTGLLPANVTQISGDSTAADNLEADYDGTGYNKSNSTIGTTTTNTDMRGTDSAATASALATVDGIVDAILVDTDATIPALIAALNDLSAAQVNAEADTAISDAALATAAALATVDSNVDAVKVATDQMVFTNTNELDVNTKSINDAEVVGDGNAVPWDGA